MKNIKQYYKELGKLVYAVAVADGVIQEEERHKLHQFVAKELAYREATTDSSGMNQAFYVDFEFDRAESEHMQLNGSIRSFTKFVQANREPNDTELIQNSITLLESVALAYSREKEKSIIESVRHGINEISEDLLKDKD